MSNFYISQHKVPLPEQFKVFFCWFLLTIPKLQFDSPLVNASTFSLRSEMSFFAKVSVIVKQKAVAITNTEIPIQIFCFIILEFKVDVLQCRFYHFNGWESFGFGLI